MAESDFSVTVVRQGPVDVVRVSGDVDLYRAPEVSAVFDQLLEERSGNVLADLLAVEFMDSTGLAVMMRTQSRLSAQGRKLALCATAYPVRSLFDFSGVDAVLPLHASIEDALTALG